MLILLALVVILLLVGWLLYGTFERSRVPITLDAPPVAHPPATLSGPASKGFERQIRIMKK